MRVMLATIALNEIEWLPKLVEQHKDWPGLCGWVFVEGADKRYAEVNPGMVTAEGLSVDGTTSFLSRTCSTENLIHVRGGISSGFARDQNKIPLRNRYLEEADRLRPDVIVQLDCDEFYTRKDQEAINLMCGIHLQGYNAIMLKQRHIWRPPVLANPSNLLSQEVVGGYWQVPHTRIWRWIPGMRHRRNHNWPETEGGYLTRNMLRVDLMRGDHPQCVHMGYASSIRSRSAKHSYYVARGEGQELGRVGRRRRMYLDCRSAWENWKPGETLPHGAEIIEYKGPVPEVFR